VLRSFLLCNNGRRLPGVVSIGGDIVLLRDQVHSLDAFKHGIGVDRTLKDRFHCGVRGRIGIGGTPRVEHPDGPGIGIRLCIHLRDLRDDLRLGGPNLRVLSDDRICVSGDRHVRIRGSHGDTAAAIGPGRGLPRRSCIRLHREQTSGIDDDPVSVYIRNGPVIIPDERVIVDVIVDRTPRLVHFYQPT